MKRVSYAAIALCAATVTWATLTFVVQTDSAAAVSQMKVSSDVSAVPAHSGVSLSPLAERELPRDAANRLLVTADRAIATAKAAFNLDDSDLDTGVGLVMAHFTQPGNPRIHELPVWIVVANVEMMSQGPPQQAHFTTPNLCIIVDARTGRMVLAYAAGPKTWVPPSR